MPVRFDAAARRAIDLAMIEVERRGHATLEVEHLLIGLLAARDGALPAVLALAGIDVQRLREAAAAATEPFATTAGRSVDIARATERILQRGSEIARERGTHTVTDLDIFLAAAEQRDGRIAALLREHGMALETLQRLASAVQESSVPAASPGGGAAQSSGAVRVGIGYDSHRFAPGGPLVLGGLRLACDEHLAGHSDGDAVAHALTDAVLGAAAAGDIGEMFADTDPANRGRDSLGMLRDAVGRALAEGWRVQQVDVTVIAERPRIGPHRDAMRAALATALGIAAADVGLKGKTNEGMGWVGRGEGIACIAVATVTAASRRT